MSPRSRSRQRRAKAAGAAARGPELELPGLKPVYRTYVESAADLLRQPDALHAEIWVSTQLGELRTAAPHALGHGAALRDLLRVLHRARSPGARTFLRVFSVIGPVALRAEASRRLGAPGQDEPAWVARLGHVTPEGAWLVRGFGPQDGVALLVGFGYTGDDDGHGLLFALVDTVRGPIPVEIMVTSALSRMLGSLRDDDTTDLEPVALAQAATQLRAAFATASEVVLPVGEESHLHANLAFAIHRIQQLP